LIEQKLAASLGIGQPTLREALKELEHEGFVYKIPQKGTYITVFNKSDCCELLEMRMSLEILAIEKAARNMTPRVEEELEALVAGMSTAADAFDIVRFHKCDAEFHRKISALSNNSRLAKTLESIISQMFVYGTLGRKPESRKEFVDGAEQHRQILNGLASKDRSEARRAFVTATLKHWNDCYQLGLRENDISAPVILTRVEASPEAAPA
jgi:DNA-binding GntR family transcriptional regulator